MNIRANTEQDFGPNVDALTTPFPSSGSDPNA
jgi:hypothetical protein